MSKANKEYCPMCASELESWDYKLWPDCEGESYGSYDDYEEDDNDN